MKICAKCGGELSDFAVSCSFCGASLLAGADSKTAATSSFTDGTDTQGFGYGDPVVSKGSVSSRKRNKTGIVSGLLFFIACIVAIGFIVGKMYINKQAQEKFNKEQAEVTTKWMTAMSENRMDEFLQLSYCDDLMTAAEKVNGLTHAEYIAYLNKAYISQKLYNIQLKDIKVTKSTEIAASEVDSINKKIEDVIGKSNVIEKMYKVTATYQQYDVDEWIDKTEDFRMYKSGGKLYVYCDIFE